MSKTMQCSFPDCSRCRSLSAMKSAGAPSTPSFTPSIDTANSAPAAQTEIKTPPFAGFFAESKWWSTWRKNKHSSTRRTVSASEASHAPPNSPSASKPEYVRAIYTYPGKEKYVCRHSAPPPGKYQSVKLSLNTDSSASRPRRKRV